VKPAHFDALTFTLQPVLERKTGVKFIWGEVKELNGVDKSAVVQPIYAKDKETIKFDYCIICAGCNFGPFQPNGESLWFPVIHEEAKKISQWSHIDERFIEGRRRHILEEYHRIAEMAKIDECREGLWGRLIWHFVHHTPCNLWGRGHLYDY